MQTMPSPAHKPLFQRVFAMPQTHLGWLALLMIAGHVVSLLLWRLLHVFGQAGGDTFFSNPWLASTLLLAGAFAIAAGVLAVVSVVWKGERSIVELVPFLYGLLVTAFALAEMLGPH